MARTRGERGRRRADRAQTGGAAGSDSGEDGGSDSSQATAAGSGTPADADRPPQLAEGIELIGQYEDSGFKDPPYIARRSDGQMIQLPPLLYFLAEEIDGRRGYDELAEGLSDKLERGVTADMVRQLVEEKLRPIGVLAEADGSSPAKQKADPMLALKLRTAVVPKALTRVLTSIFYPAFFPPVVLAVIAAIVAVDVWFFFIHGAAQSTRELIYNPLLVLMVLGLVVLATALHEIGHATAARYGGAEPGVMGVGIYIVWPAFYTDVTDAYRLGRGGRLRTDLGGVYFNGIFVLGIVGAYALTGFEPLLILIPIQHLQVLQQFLPFLRLDGYYILSDLTGVPDMFQRLKPTLKSLLPWRGTDDKVDELKPWVRWAISGWVVALVPVLLGTFGLLLFNLPRMVATAWDSFWLQADRISDAYANGAGLTIAVAALQATFLLLPVAGLSVTFARIGRRMAGGAWGWSSESVLRRGLVLLTTGAAVGLSAYVLLPNGEYRPIQPGERGTLQGGIQQFGHVGSGRPGLAAGARARPGRRADGARAAQRRRGRAGHPDDDHDDRDRDADRDDRHDSDDHSVHDRDDADDDRDDPHQLHVDDDDHHHDDHHVHHDDDAGGDDEPRRHHRRPGGTAMRRLLALLFVLLATAASLGAHAEAAYAGDDNVAVALNTKDGGSIFKLAFSIRKVAGEVVDNTNAAVAYSSCTECSTTAIAIQIVLVTGDPDVVTPTNLAVAVNENCTLCTTFAAAYQIVLSTDGPVKLTGEGRKRIKDIVKEIKRLKKEDLQPAELDARLDALVGELKQVLATELVPKGKDERGRGRGGGARGRGDLHGGRDDSGIRRDDDGRGADRDGHDHDAGDDYDDADHHDVDDHDTRRPRRRARERRPHRERSSHGRSRWSASSPLSPAVAETRSRVIRAPHSPRRRASSGRSGAASSTSGS